MESWGFESLRVLQLILWTTPVYSVNQPMNDVTCMPY